MHSDYLMPNPMTPCECVTFDETKCIGCNTCVESCRTDVLVPNPTKGQPPYVLFADECWFCGCCVQDCPVDGANAMHHPLNQKMTWKHKATGELRRILD